MGSPIRLSIGGAGVPAGQARRLWRLVVDEFEAAEAALSRFRDASELTGFNRMAGSGVPGRPSTRLRRALVTADRARRLTGGRFDPRVLSDLDRLGYRGATLSAGTVAVRESERPDPAEAVVVRSDRHRLTLGRPADLGGIGKGLTLRWAAGVLDRHGATDYLLEAGGDIVARGASPERGPWLLALEDPAGGSDPLAVIAATDHGVATSSIGVHHWTVDGQAVHHLIDPRTGEPGRGGLASVTVAARDPAWAEVWSKVLFLGGRQAIPAEARSRGLAAWWVADDGTVEMTAGARLQTVWLAAEAC